MSNSTSSPARRWTVDAALAVTVTGLQVAAWLGAATHSGHPRPGIADYLFLAVGGAALLVRRRYPVAVLAVVLAAASAGSTSSTTTWD